MTQWLAKHASLTTRPTQNIKYLEFNALCTPLHHCPNTDNTRHIYVTTGDRQRILNTPPPTTTILTKSTTTTLKNRKNSTTTTTTITSNPGTTTGNSIMAQTTRVGEFFFITKQYLQLLWLHQSYGGAQGRRRQGERAQTMWIASFGPLVSFFFFFRVF